MQDGFRSGFVIIIGRPNAGKSTLLNCLLGSKVAIMSDKPQTTRNKIQGIYTSEKAQIIFIDTPGVHKPKHRLGEMMVNTVLRSLREADIVLYLVDVSEDIGRGEQFILNNLQGIKTPVILGLNKIDLVEREAAVEAGEILCSGFNFAEIVPLSAVTGENVSELLNLLLKYLPEGPKYYPDDMITDRPEKFIIGELIREKVLDSTRDEVPHSCAVKVDEITPRNGLVYISSTVFVERESQKGIIIGKGGLMLKEIGSSARRDIEGLLGSRVFIELRVKVKKGWRKNDAALRHLGYTPE